MLKMHLFFLVFFFSLLLLDDESLNIALAGPWRAFTKSISLGFLKQLHGLKREKFSGRGTLSQPRSLCQGVWGQCGKQGSAGAIPPLLWQPCHSPGIYLPL